MSREIKFRGICTAPGEFNGKWVYGDLLQKNGTTYITPFVNVVEVKGGHIGKLIIMHEVKPETVGQYTGVEDKNGTPIYEGDIVDYGAADNSVVRFYDGIFWAREGQYTIRSVQHNIDVIGNVWERPKASVSTESTQPKA